MYRLQRWRQARQEPKVDGARLCGAPHYRRGPRRHGQRNGQRLGDERSCRAAYAYCDTCRAYSLGISAHYRWMMSGCGCALPARGLPAIAGRGPVEASAN